MHFVEKCKECGDVISQCRCPDPNKAVTFGVCVRCALKAKQIAEVRREAGMSETMGWTCGCGWNNGINLAVCATCGRTPTEGLGVGFDRRAERATLTDYRAIYERVAAAIGDDRYLDPPDGGSVEVDEQVRRMRAERDTLTAQVAEQQKALKCDGCGSVAHTERYCIKCCQEDTAELEAKLAEQAQEIERLKAQEWRLLNGGACEIGATNPNLADHTAHWEGRAEKAEAKLSAVEALRDELRVDAKAYGMVPADMVVKRIAAILTPEAQS